MWLTIELFLGERKLQYGLYFELNFAQIFFLRCLPKPNQGFYEKNNIDF